jgi:hypothetical protein
VGKTEEKRPIGRPRRRREYNIKMDLREIGWGGIDWIHLTWARDQWRALENTMMSLRVPYNVGKFLSNGSTVSFSRTGLHGVRYTPRSSSRGAGFDLDL